MGGERREESRIGYLSYLTVAGRHRGGLLVVDMDGDPVDFAFTSAVEMSRLALPLFGGRLEGYLVGKVFVKPLLEAIGTTPDVLCFNEPALLSRRVNVDIPLALCAPARASVGDQWVRMDTEALPEEENGFLWFSQAGKEQFVQGVLAEAARRFAPLSIAEPFDRLLLAVKECVENSPSLPPSS